MNRHDHHHHPHHPHHYHHRDGSHGGTSSFDRNLAPHHPGNLPVLRVPDSVPLPRVDTPSRPGFFSRNGSLSRSSSQRQKTKQPAPPPTPLVVPCCSSCPSTSTAATISATNATSPPLTATTIPPSSSFHSPERRPFLKDSPTKRKVSGTVGNKGKSISRLIIPNFSANSNQNTSSGDSQSLPQTPLDIPGIFWAKTPTIGGQTMDFQMYGGLPGAPPPTSGGGAFGPQSASSIYMNIHQTSSKRISTLDYLRKAHEGSVYWFNTVHFSKSDLSRMSYFEQRKLSRRAINYLLLGLSIPPLLDVSTTPFEYLRALNALLMEFETFQQVHPADGNASSSLGRARIPHMFKRSAHSGAKTRRASSATEIGLPMQTSDPSDIKAMTGNIATSSNSSATTSYPSTDSSDLLPGEEYTYLLTPTLPFDPDFFETFSSLCDVLIDCYTRLMALVSGPAVCSAVIAEMFTKADSRLRKVMIAGVVKEFEDASRSNVKSEIAGVNKVLLGGLLG
ncbi:hypothetical protein, variant 2 [Blastomyces dermatitidis ATCC 26199]|nr:hypothetical protein BDFG_05821 [Blastomyces dermatitidis ATCC 26199]EQL31926.1 hypothetical protein, variant 1 [Blastomyces dermatitidis ATCC 26199]EQL31927.1 hypothetical protein, variant 2 [Blastomyces dermatitidis ATCC 26199]